MPIVSPVTTHHDIATPSTRRRDDDRARFVLGAATAIGVGLIAAAEPLVEFSVEILPNRMFVTSRGRSYPSFNEVGASVVRRTGIALLLSVVVAGVSRSRARSRHLDTALTSGIIGGTACWYGWLGTPHNGFPSNARYHWVDYLTFNDDYFFYAAGRLPHMVFYEAPYLWQAINAGVIAYLFYAIARRLGLSIPLAQLVALFPAISSNMLLFSSAAEDVLINVALILFVIHASLGRRPIIFGLALALAILGRPPFLLFIPCAIAAELVPLLRRPVAAKRVDWTYTAIFTIAAAAFTLIAQIVFTLMGDRYFLVNGRIVDTAVLDAATPAEVDGFTIHAFSGAYVGHTLWMVPAAFLVVAVLTLGSLASQHVPTRHTAIFSTLAAIGIILVHEARPQTAYAQRYLTYTLPFVVVVAWTWLAPRRRADGASAPWSRQPTGMIAVFTAAALTFGAMTLPVQPIQEKRTREQRVELELLGIKHGLRGLAADRCVYFSDGARSSQNYLSYVLKTSRWSLDPIGDRADGDLIPGSLVIRRRDDSPHGITALLETDTYDVYLLPTDANVRGIRASDGCRAVAVDPSGAASGG